MLYVETDGVKYPINNFEVFKTQFGNSAIRIYGDAPITDGFRLYDEDVLIGDFSEYEYLYREDSDCKEYTKVAEEPIPTESYASGDTHVSPIERQISALNSRISDITPYVESKDAGIQDKECIFYGSYKDGLLTASVVTSRGEQIPCKTEKSGDDIIVRFEELKDTATVTISIQ